MLKLYRGLEDPDFLRQLHTVGVLAQFESLLSTHGKYTLVTHSHTMENSHWWDQIIVTMFEDLVAFDMVALKTGTRSHDWVIHVLKW